MLSTANLKKKILTFEASGFLSNLEDFILPVDQNALFYLVNRSKPSYFLSAIDVVTVNICLYLIRLHYDTCFKIMLS